LGVPMTMPGLPGHSYRSSGRTRSADSRRVSPGLMTHVFAGRSKADAAGQFKAIARIARDVRRTRLTAESHPAVPEMLKQVFSHRDRDRFRQHVADFKRSTQRGC
jgi:hypothetical protein